MIVANGDGIEAGVWVQEWVFGGSGGEVVNDFDLVVGKGKGARGFLPADDGVFALAIGYMCVVVDGHFCILSRLFESLDGSRISVKVCVVV